MSAQHGNLSRLPLNAEIAAMLRDGATLEDLAKRYGVNPATISGHLSSAGWGTDGNPVGETARRRRLPVFSAPAWMDRALCAQVGGDGFFPDKGTPGEPADNGVSVVQAKTVCRTCPVQQECLDYALENDERFGIWGGLSERERRRMKKGISIDAPGPVDQGLVREWARDQGYRVADVGRVSPKIVAAYEEAHGSAAPKCEDCGDLREPRRRFCDPCRNRRRRAAHAASYKRTRAS